MKGGQCEKQEKKNGCEDIIEQNEYKSLRTRREPATAPAWALSWGIEMAKTENRKPQKSMGGSESDRETQRAEGEDNEKGLGESS